MHGSESTGALLCIARPYRRRRRICHVAAHLALSIAALTVGLSTLTCPLTTRACAAGCMVALGCISLLLSSRPGTRILDRIPLAPPISQLAHHALALHALVRPFDRGGPALLEDCRPLLDLIAYTARRTHPHATDTIPRIAAEDIADLAHLPAGSAQPTPTARRGDDLSGIASTVLALTHLAALPSPPRM